jgi:outer membrane protein
MIVRIAAIAFALLATSLTAAARADDDVLNNSVRVGAYYIIYDTNAEDITGPYVPAGTNLKLKNVVTPYFAYVRRLSDHFSVEFAGGVPPLTKTEGKGPAKLGSVPYNDQVVVTARWLAPSVLLNYSFFDESAALRPYVGAGINYTRFYSRQSTAAGNAATGGPTRIDLTTSVGPAATVGLNYRINRHFYVIGSFSASEVDSRLKANTAGLIRTTHINFGPRAFVLAAGYSF